MYLGVRKTFDRLLDAARVVGPDGLRPIDSPLVRDALMARLGDVRNLEFLAKRALDAALRGRSPGAEGSVIKLAWSQTSQALAETAIDVLGPGALGGPWANGLVSSRSLTIAGGTTEVNKNIIGERVLGLPREPRPT
jgi:alkylation response protein AidB-like acyl-CoA dehydrogenase